MKKIILPIVIFFSLQSFAQNPPRQSGDTIATRLADSSSVVVHKDPRLDLLVARQVQANELASRDARRIAKGFRLLVISTDSRDEAIAAKTKIYTYFPELKAYLWHQSPYYKVKAGNFKDRKDAEEYLKRLNVYFPKGVFIMNDVVELKLDKPWEEENL